MYDLSNKDGIPIIAFNILEPYKMYDLSNGLVFGEKYTWDFGTL